MAEANLKIDFTKTIGSINPLHGINNAPVLGGEACANSALFHYMKEAGDRKSVV